MAEEAKSTGPVRMVAIENMVENIRYKSQILTVGLLVALILIVVPAILVG